MRLSVDSIEAYLGEEASIDALAKMAALSPLAEYI